MNSYYFILNDKSWQVGPVTRTVKDKNVKRNFIGCLTEMDKELRATSDRLPSKPVKPPLPRQKNYGSLLRVVCFSLTPLPLALQGNSLKRRFPMLSDLVGPHSDFICCDSHALHLARAFFLFPFTFFFVIIIAIFSFLIISSFFF